MEALVREVRNDSIQPPLDAGIHRRELPASANGSAELRLVLTVEVPRSLFVHESPGGYLRRLGSSKRRMEPMVLQRLMMLRSQTGIASFDELPVSGTTPGDLHPDLAERFVSEEADFDLAVRKLSLIVKGEDEVERLSVAGSRRLRPEVR